jgi:hypothetical protein
MPVNPIVCIKRRSTCQTKRGFPFNPSTKEENWSVLSEIYFSRCIRSNVDGDTFLSSSGLKKKNLKRIQFDSEYPQLFEPK